MNMTRIAPIAGLLLALLPVTPLEAQEPDAPTPIDALDSVWLEELTWMEVRDAIEPGNSALFLLTRDGNIERIEQELSDFDHEFEIIDTNLSPEDDERLRETFAAEEVAG